jgi:hypothetical protein
MKDITKLAVKLTCKPEISEGVMDDIDKGKVIVPSARRCRSDKVKLDVLAMLFERTRLERFQTWRYLMTDGSPLHGWNFLNTRSEEIFFPKSLDEIGMLEALRCNGHGFRRRTCPLMTTGYGRASLVDKANVLGRQLHVDSVSSEASFDQMRSEVENLATDQSTETGIADTANVVGDLDAIKRDIERVMAEDADIGSEEVSSSRLLPNCVLTTDALHILFKRPRVLP